MKATSVKPSMNEKMDTVRSFFLERASAAGKAEDRELYRELLTLAECVEELASLQEHSKIQIEEVRHGTGLHPERSGAVPHTRRPR